MLQQIFEILGTIAFSLSGAFVGMEKKMDILGIATMSVMTATGGGVIRDLLIGITPPAAFRNPLFALISLVTALLVFLPYVNRKINLDNILWVAADSIGLGAFTMTGASMGAAFDNIFLEIFLGVVTGVGGGVIRDVCTGEISMIFVKGFYASPSIIGAFVYAVLSRQYPDFALVLGFAAVVSLRLLAARFNWQLPRAK